MGEKAFFVAGEALPANISALVRRHDEGVVVLHFAIALFTADRFAVDDFRVEGFHHLNDLLRSDTLLILF